MANASVKILPTPSHETDHNVCCHKAHLAFTDAFWATVPSDIARWLSADMICEIIELAEGDYTAEDMPDIIWERESAYQTGYPVNLLPGTVRRILDLAGFYGGTAMSCVFTSDFLNFLSAISPHSGCVIRGKVPVMPPCESGATAYAVDLAGDVVTGGGLL